MERRKYLILSGTTAISLFSGCTSDTNEDDESDVSNTDDADNEESSDEAEENDNEETEDTEDIEETEEDEESSENSTTTNLPIVEIIIEYTGDWSGEINVDDSSRAISGSGNDTLEADVNESTTSVGVTVEKEDSTDDELAVQILIDGEIESEASANAPSGMVSLSTTI